MEEYSKKKELKIISFDEVEAVEVEFLWYPYVPYGKICIWQGDPGGGKTTLILQLAAILSRGDKLPFTEERCNPINILYQSAEDGKGDTIKPRLLAANADCSRIKFIDDEDDPLTMLDERIEEAIKKLGAKLVILDPLQNFFRGDMNRANEVRPVLKKIGDIAQKYKCSFILIGHMNKNSKSKSTYRLLGSIDFQAAARSIILVNKIDPNSGKRAMVHDKSSLAPEGKSIEFEISKDNGFMWTGYSDITASELLSGYRRESKLSKAKKLLEDILKDGKVEYKEILSQAESLGISLRTLEQAKTNLGVKSKRIGKCSHWYMS